MSIDLSCHFTNSHAACQLLECCVLEGGEIDRFSCRCTPRPDYERERMVDGRPVSIDRQSEARGATRLAYLAYLVG